MTEFNTLYVDTNVRPQGHRHLLARPPGIFCCAKALGLGTTFRCKSPGVPGGMVTGQIDTCIRPFSTYNYKSYIFHTCSEFWRARRKINMERKRGTWKLHRLLFSWLLDQVRTFWAILELLALGSYTAWTSSYLAQRSHLVRNKCAPDRSQKQVHAQFAGRFKLFTF